MFVISGPAIGVSNVAFVALGQARPSQTGAAPERSQSSTGTPVPAGKALPAPADWDTYTDVEKGYRFKLPKGTQTDSRSVAGFDRLIAMVPEPRKVAVMVVVFRESRFSKDELLEAAKRTLERLGEKEIKVDSRITLSEDHELAALTSDAGNGMITKIKSLLATRGTDNYVMLVGSPEPSFKADEPTIDQIWGSFVMLGSSPKQTQQF